MRGIILAGGTGSRLWPLTIGLNKQSLPVYDKPMIYYPLATLMAAGIRDVLVISSPRDLGFFKNLLKDGSAIGISIQYESQETPSGISDAFVLGADFIGANRVALILGDNIFHGTGLGRQLMDLQDTNGAHIFAHKVADASKYGVIEFDELGKPKRIIEKPKDIGTGFAIPGFYFFDNRVVALAKDVIPSARGEKEITSLLTSYLQTDELEVTILPRGTAWLDTGTVEALHDATTYVRIIEERQGSKIACLEEIAWRQGWITSAQLSDLTALLPPSPYGEYLKSLIGDESMRTW